MEFLPSNKLGQADGLSRIIPRFCGPLEDTVIVALIPESKIKNVLFNTVRGLPVALTDVKNKIRKGSSIYGKKKQVRWKLNDK